jgi:hypothetical protein
MKSRDRDERARRCSGTAEQRTGNLGVMCADFQAFSTTRNAASTCADATERMRAIRRISRIPAHDHRDGASFTSASASPAVPVHDTPPGGGQGSAARPSSHGRLLRIAIRWICAWRISAPCGGSPPLQKRGCRPLAGSGRSAKDLWPPARLGRSASGGRGASLPHVRLRSNRAHGMLATATSGRGPEEKAASGRMHQALGRPVAGGGGRPSAFFRRGTMVTAEADDGPGTSST